MLKGKKNVKNPNKRLLFLLDLNSFKSNSRPAINIIYRSPIVEKRSIAEFCSRIFKLWGPIITPDMINPIIPGILNRLSSIGESRIINSINENINTGFVSGRENSCIKWLKKSVICYF
jgi:hypothetical protein